MRVFESFSSFLNEGFDADAAYSLFKRIGGRKIERKPAYTADLFSSSAYVELTPAQDKEINTAGIPVYTSKDLWGRMAPRYIGADWMHVPSETIFIMYLNHEQGELKDYYGQCVFVNTEGASYMRYGFGMDFEPELHMFSMGIPESFEYDLDESVMSEIDLLAKTSKNFKEFVKAFKTDKSYKGLDSVGETEEFEAWLQTVYDNAKMDEAIDTELDESKIQLKRQYTDAYPQITVAKFAPIRNRVIEAISGGKITKEQFETIIKEFSTASKKWARNNRHYFNVSEDGISLSKYGQRILSKIKAVNENE